MQRFIAIAALAAGQAYASDRCYALAFSSGDESSAYQAGVLKGLSDALGEDMADYQAISGVSGGAVNAAILANYAKGKEADAADRMVKFWEDASNSKLYKDWIGGIVTGLLYKGGLYDDSPLKSFLQTELADITPTQRWIDVGLTDVLKGEYVDFTGDQLTGDEFFNVLFAQFAQAGVFPPTAFDNTDWFDGSTIWDLDIFSVVNKCQETFTDDKITVDVILTSEKTLSTVDASNYKSLQMLWRYLQVSRYYSSMDGLLRAQFAYPNVEFRYIIAPSADLPSSIYPLNLDQSQVDTMVQMGIQDAIDAVNGGKAESENTAHFFALKNSHDERVKSKNYNEFCEMKSNGFFGENYSLLEDKNMATLFLQ